MKVKCKKTKKVLIGADYSQLEVKTAVHTCKDPACIEAYKEKKDLYALIASMSFGRPYEDCLEFYPEGTILQTPNGEIVCGKHEVTNYEGKEYRQESKAILIGSLYQRGAQSIADQINETVKDASKKKTKDEVQKMMDSFYAGFPVMSQWFEDSKKFVREHGYIDNALGRRRLLPEGMLPPYSIEVSQTNTNSKFNPFLNCENKVDDTLKKKYEKKLEGARYRKDVETIQKEAALEGVTIKNNNGLIAQAERRAINTQCQSLGADIVKRVMLVVDADPVLKDLGFTLLLQIHDEIIGECPEETKEECINRLNDIMFQVPEDLGIVVPFYSDAYAVTNWYIDEMEASILETYNVLTQEEHKSKEEALEIIYNKHTELPKEAIYDYLINEKTLRAS